MQMKQSFVQKNFDSHEKLLWNARYQMVSVMSLNFEKFFEIAVDDDDGSFVYSIKENIYLFYKQFLVEMPAINHKKKSFEFRCQCWIFC